MGSCAHGTVGRTGCDYLLDSVVFVLVKVKVIVLADYGRLCFE